MSVCFLIESNILRITRCNWNQWINQSINQPTHQPINPSIHPSINEIIYVSIYTSVHPSIDQSAHLCHDVKGLKNLKHGTILKKTPPVWRHKCCWQREKNNICPNIFDSVPRCAMKLITHVFQWCLPMKSMETSPYVFSGRFMIPHSVSISRHKHIPHGPEDQGQQGRHQSQNRTSALAGYNFKMDSNVICPIGFMAFTYTTLHIHTHPEIPKSFKLSHWLLWELFSWVFQPSF